MSRFEKKFGKYAIKNISVMLLLCYAVGYIIEAVNIGFLQYLTLNPYAILHGEVWRLVTWILIPPSSLGGSMGIFFVCIMLLFYYNIGTTLERTWGTYRYNVYLFSGMLFTVVGSFVWMLIQYASAGWDMDPAYASVIFNMSSLFFSTYYINMSIFLAFAATFPEVQVLLMFLIPVKVKWMGVLYGVMLLYDFIWEATAVGRVAIVSSLLNFVIFFLTSRSHIHMSPKQIKRRVEFKQDIKRNTRGTRHKCAICGQTEEDDPSLEFRFCSKCSGNHEYCQNHLFTHTHIK
ncbi:hypothetical protein D7X48_00285 [bacterium D16-50]|jgi:hypothetical protein|nr:hypothetical protein [Lachnospiraceae bacterium]RKJ22057.1 hypothetical protein D7X48_00285 [bacterium D16-50]